MDRARTALGRLVAAVRLAGAAVYPGEFGAVADWRAIGAGGGVQAALTAGILLAGLPRWTVAGAVVAGAAVGGGLSRTFESEYLDGAGATAAGTLLTLVLLLGWLWYLSRGLAPVWRANFVWLGSVFGGFAVFVALPFVCAVGAVVGHWAAVLRRAYRSGG